MSEGQGNHQPAEPEIRTRRWHLSLVWLIPLVAALVGVSMLVQYWREKGPVIEITFKTAEGLSPGQTPVKYRNVVIGELVEVSLGKDRERVIATVELNREAEDFTRDDSRFWVVRPRIGVEGISGLGTLFSGDFIAADPGNASSRSETFTGLESPPPVTYGESGTHFTLQADDLGSLVIGSPVYFRKVNVGQVVSYQLDDGGKAVEVGVFIESPNDRYVTENTRFWNASGLELGVSTTGVQVNMESVVSVLTGGIAFAEPSAGGQAERAAEGTEFPLFAEKKTALAPLKGPIQRIRMSFSGSLRGLKVGAPVDFMGKSIGEVTRITLDYDASNQSFPVVVNAEVHPQLMGEAYEKLMARMDRNLSRPRALKMLFEGFVDRGLRAEARNANLLTGQLYIALDLYPEAEPVDFQSQGDVVALPTRPASLDRVQEQLTDLVEQLSRVPFEEIAANFDGSLSELRQTLAQVNTEVLPATQETLQGIDELMVEMQATLNSAAETFERNSPERERLGRALTEIERMSRSVRELSDYLRRHPESLIRGR